MLNKRIKYFVKYLCLSCLLLLISGCSENQSIVNSVDERAANEILVYLSSKNIEAKKIKNADNQTGAATITTYSITVDPKDAIEAMALLNQQGLPRTQGTTLLQLFAKSGLMSSDKEENIRYQAGQEEELKNIIRKIDGVIDADVQISFPSTEILPGEKAPKTKAAVYVKHQGVFDDPNTHLETKIKRLLSGAIENLNFEDVSVISDKAKIASISLNDKTTEIAKGTKPKDYVSIWSIIMTKNSASKFRVLFIFFIGLILVFAAATGWLIYKFYPYLRRSEKK